MNVRKVSYIIDDLPPIVWVSIHSRIMLAKAG